MEEIEIQILAKELIEKKAEDVRIFEVSNLTPLAAYYILASASNERMLNGLKEAVLAKAALLNLKVHHVEGKKSPAWVIIDLSGALVHLFSTEERQRIALDKLVSECEEIKIEE